jgi:flagellar biosynthesis protein FlhG
MNQAATLKEWKEFGGIPKAETGSQGRRLREAGRFPRVICFSSGKGGVGKTSIVTNLALALARLGKRVLVLDADLGLANVDVMLGLVPKYSIQHVFAGKKEIADIIVEGPEGIKLLPASSGIQELVNLNESEKLFLLSEFDSLDLPLDMMLIDNAAGISDTVMYFNMAAQERVVILTPEPTSITDAYALIKVLFNKHRVTRFHIIINWVNSSGEAQKVFNQLATVADKFLGFLSLNFLGFIPKDSSVPKSVRQQKPALELYPDSRACKKFLELAENLVNTQVKSAQDGNIKFFWKNLLGI